HILTGETGKPFTRGSGRLELAEAIANKANPLTARVMVNRIWLHHFGAGLVQTPSDFGTRCEAPSHPALLDWLACRFMAAGWGLNKLNGLIRLWSVYQQSSEGGQASNLPGARKAASSSTVASVTSASAVDPENRLLWHFNRQRLDFESARDSLLAVSGELDA